MIITSVWLTKLILAHLITDFILQPVGWVNDRTEKHFGSFKLYLHGCITALLAWIMIGWQYWAVALVILISHILIDGWKSYQKNNVAYFLFDQFFHLLIIALCWYFTFIKWVDVQLVWQQINSIPSTNPIIIS